MDKYTKAINKYYFNLLLKGERVFYTKRCGFVFLSDKYIISVIPEKDFFINNDLLNKDVDLSIYIDNVMDMKYYNSINDWSFIKSNENKKFTDEVLLYNDKCKTYIDKKYFRLFYYPPKYDLYITHIKNQPVLVFDNESLIGFILPIIHKEVK